MVRNIKISGMTALIDAITDPEEVTQEETPVESVEADTESRSAKKRIIK